MSYRPDPKILTLGPEFYDVVEQAAFPKCIPRFVNERWAERVGLQLNEDAWKRHFCRFDPLPENLTEPLALRYHGHQFRVYNPDIGDGRGFTFAQLRDDRNRLLDLGTKGSGQTPYSRTADGRLTLKGGVREVLATEMLEALGVNTSKSFALFETGEQLERGDEPSPTRSAVLTRLSHGHIRIGTFQRLAFFEEVDLLKKLTRYSLENLYGEQASDDDAENALHLFDLVNAATAALAASYIAAGFVHGVLNSDNINITGESFDYGPWRFTPQWEPEFTAAYFDHDGLYAFGRQPEAIHWDLAQLAGCLSLVGEAPKLSELLGGWSSRFDDALVDALLTRLDIERGDDDRPVAGALVRALGTRVQPIDRIFFDWRGGNDPGPGLYPAEQFRELGALLEGQQRPKSHPYWSSEGPCSMHIAEVETIWSAIGERDDWQPFDNKVKAIRLMGAAMGRMQGQAETKAEPAARKPASDELVSTDPSTGKELWSGKIGDEAAEVAAARAAWPEWAAHSNAYRAEALRRFANVVRKEEAGFAELIARETGKPLWESKTEVASVVNKVDISIDAYGERTPQRRMEAALGNKIAVRHKPHGVLAVLGPYNFPAHLPNGHIVPALIAGNAVVFKPSEKTPATGEFLVQCYHEAGIPEGVVRLLVGGPDQGRALAAQSGIDGLLFTGSARAGMALHKQFAETPQKILALELGGNNPLVIWHAKDLDSAAAIAVQSAYLSAGQRCTAARRLIVPDEEHEGLITAIRKLIDRMIVGEPFADPQPFMGPLIDTAAADHVQEQWLNLMMKGGKPICRLERPDAEKPFVTPGLIDVTDVRDRPDEEIFGPVLQVIRVKDFDAAIAEANNTRFGLAASLIGGSPEMYDKFWANVRAGVINWNKPTNGAPSNAPFGGVGLSGNHRPSAFYAADYCAYPVTSSEADRPRAVIGEGLSDPNKQED